MRKTWKLINELNSRQQKPTGIAELKIDGDSLTAADDIAEAMNARFANTGENLAQEIPDTDITVFSGL